MRLLRHIIICIALGIGVLCHAQSPRNMDEDIRMAIPHYNCSLDEYTQYAPGAVMLGLKVCGYEGRTGWGQMLTADAFSAILMAGITQGLKYGLNRTRPDGEHRSFPSGHTATAFMTATMLHKEYGWRSPWWSIGSYTVAAYTGVSRMMNDKHWMSDVACGAAIGIGSVHLGYYLSDLIFKDKYINPAYEASDFSYDHKARHYTAEVYFGRRFPLGAGRDPFSGRKVERGGCAGLSTDIGIAAGSGITARLGANSLTYSDGLTGQSYNALAGGFYNMHFARRFEAQAKAMAGAAWSGAGVPHAAHSIESCISTGLSLSFLLDDNFKIKAFADYEAIGSSRSGWLHSAILGWSTAWVW